MLASSVIRSMVIMRFMYEYCRPVGGMFLWITVSGNQASADIPGKQNFHQKEIADVLRIVVKG